MRSATLDARMWGRLKRLGVLARAAEPVEPSAPGPLTGIQLAVKDNIGIGGLPHAGASPALSGHVAQSDAECVARLRAAGASVLMQTNMHELAFGITSANAHAGTVLNPWDSTRVAGGSSGGTAVAVAMGAVAAGLGTDTGGSGRIPAALCGCVGMRPTTGRYPAGGVLTLSSTLDTISAMAGNVATLARVDAVLASDIDPGELDTVKPNEIVIGLAIEPFWTGPSTEIVERTRLSIDALASVGFRIVEFQDPALTHAAAITSAIAVPLAGAEVALHWRCFSREQLGIDLDEFVSRIASVDVRNIFSTIAASATDPEAYRLLLEQREEACAAMDTIWKNHGIHALAHPANPARAPALDEFELITIDGTVHDTFTAFTEARLIASITATPALTLPVGLDGIGLPLGLELVGRSGTDRRLLSIAAAAEAVFEPPFNRSMFNQSTSYQPFRLSNGDHS